MIIQLLGLKTIIGSISLADNNRFIFLIVLMMTRYARKINSCVPLFSVCDCNYSQLEGLLAEFIAVNLR